MKHILIAFSMIFFVQGIFNSSAMASDDMATSADEGWTQVVATTLTMQSPQYRDILISHPGTYSEVKVKFINDGAWIDRFDVISFFLWGDAIPELQGKYSQGMERTAFFSSTKVKFVRIYARPQHAGSPLQVRVWMR